jgi:hypothetical protein
VVIRVLRAQLVKLAPKGRKVKLDNKVLLARRVMKGLQVLTVPLVLKVLKAKRVKQESKEPLVNVVQLVPLAKMAQLVLKESRA